MLKQSHNKFLPVLSFSEEKEFLLNVGVKLLFCFRIKLGIKTEYKRLGKMIVIVSIFYINTEF